MNDISVITFRDLNRSSIQLSMCECANLEDRFPYHFKRIKKPRGRHCNDLDKEKYMFIHIQVKHFT